MTRINNLPVTDDEIDSLTNEQIVAIYQQHADEISKVWEMSEETTMGQAVRTWLKEMNKS